MEKKVELAQLTPEQLNELKEQWQQEEAARKQKEQDNRQAYKDLVDETIERIYKDLAQVSENLQEKKNKVMEQMRKVIEVKDELFGCKTSQATHTFTTSDGKLSITVGYRTVNDYDSTLANGVEKIKQYISSLAKDEETAKLVEMIESLLKTDKNGNMRPNRVLELSKLTMKIDNEQFRDGVEIIQQSYSPRRSKSFVSACENTEDGKKYLPLSMTNAD